MGTNYYAKLTTGETIHIGKDSRGWNFSFRRHKDRGILSGMAWVAILSKPGVTILDEYGGQHTLHDLRHFLIRRSDLRHPMADYVDPYGLAFFDGEFS